MNRLSAGGPVHQSIYLQPIGQAASPQSEEGDCIRLAGGAVYAQRFAAIVRRGGEVVERWRFTPAGLAEILERLPPDLAAEAEAQWSNLQSVHPSLECGERVIRMDQPQVMGILNVTPDSFSDGGRFHENPDAARDRAAAMLEAGAAVIDIGGESTRPGASPVWEGDEIARVVPVVQACAAMGAAISIDTRRPAVMEAALTAGAHILNDVSALRHDPRSAGVVAGSGRPVVLMHAPGDGEDLHARVTYANVLLDVFDWLRAARDRAIGEGIARERIILDPGIGFGKSLAENLALLNGLELFHALGQPLLLGASRKRMIGALSREEAADRRLGGSLALSLRGMAAGVQILRVHDVGETVQARNVWQGMRDAALTDFSSGPSL